MTIRLVRIAGTFAVARLAPGVGWPHWMTWSHGFSSFTRTTTETSIVCEARLVPDDVPAERGFAAYSVAGPLPFSAVGILSQLTTLLAAADISLLAIATHDTDVILVREATCAAAEHAWRTADIRVDA